MIVYHRTFIDTACFFGCVGDLATQDDLLIRFDVLNV